ncbi:alpha/beta fold hydrolase [Acidovorax sp. NO-1]|uniref:alpha/beta fold hydrolase n=1 Tax=Acidovorax sp. NO-1 TaxID=512030 RepID=UPI000558C163|nr:alpha/beta hydrolase [Acidovorax sp. NO-1]
MHPPWILLRGLTREAAHWGDFVSAFENALLGARVVAPDLPGNGLLHRAVSPATVRGMVEACRAQLAAHGLRPPFRVLAMSLGAMVATEWARVAPGELAGCVLINTSLRPFSPFYQRLRPASYLPVLRCVLPGASPEAIEQTVLRMTSNCAAAQASVVQDWVAVRGQRPVSAPNALRQLLAAARYRAPVAAPLPAVSGVSRILLLASQNDRLVSSQCSQAIAQAWGVPLRLHPFAGHDLPLDDAPWVIRQVRSWAEGVAA